jgi:hypothetical protein
MYKERKYGDVKKKKVIICSVFLLFLMFFLVSCSDVATYNNKNMVDESNIDTSTTTIYDDVGYDNLNKNYLINDNDLKLEFEKKFNLFPNAYKKSWLIEEIQKDLNFIGKDGLDIFNIPEIHKKVVTAGILIKVAKRELTFQKIYDQKYQNINSKITYDGIKKGDIILSVTRNPILMGLDSEDIVHHALLCVEDPMSDSSKVFLTTNGLYEPEVALYGLSQLQDYDDQVVVMRVHNADEALINKAVEFGLAQIGKDYNMYFTDKMATDKFYCNQLVWRAYYEAGIDIDCNSEKYYDYGLVLASDIYKSPYLYVVKYSD